MEQRKVKMGLRISSVLLAVMALIGAGVVVAQLPTPATEPGGEVSEASVSFDSYLDGGIVVPENGLTASGEPFVWPEGIAPDDNPVEGVARTNEANAPWPFYYYHVPGATLRERNAITEYDYDRFGCTYVTVADPDPVKGYTRILNTEAHLPDGATIKYLRLYYYDNNPTNAVRGYITRYSPAASTLDLVSATSPIPLPTPPPQPGYLPGYGFVVSKMITETVDNGGYAYTLIGWPDTIGNTLQICGLRIAYYLPQNNTVSLPVVRSR